MINSCYQKPIDHIKTSATQCVKFKTFYECSQPLRNEHTTSRVSGYTKLLDSFTDTQDV